MTVGVTSGPWDLPMTELRARDALAVLHARLYRPLVRLTIALVDDQAAAEEVVQEAFLRVLRRWDSVRDLELSEAYLRQAVINGARDRLRRRRTRRSAVLPQAALIPSAEEHVLMAAEHREVIAAIRSLPLRQREVLVLRYFADLSEREIADAMGVSTGTVKSTAHKALAALRRTLGEEQP